MKRELLKLSCSIRNGGGQNLCFSGGKHAGRYRILMVAACASLLIGQDVWPQGNPSSEYAIKAAFLFHFAQFAEWPATAFKDATTPLTFCTLGENEFHGALDDSISGKRIGNRTLRVQRLKEPQGAAECQVIFVGGNDKKRIPALLASLKDAPVLTVGDTENFVQNGGMIGLFLEDSKVRFEINLDSVERAKLRISATLLALARTVIGGSRGN